MKFFRIAALLIIFEIKLLVSQVPYNVLPSWISTDVKNYSTGCAWADINQDGWLDLVVANGNDMALQHVSVYSDTGGNLPKTPNWQSDDVDYNGHLAIGDVNNDGFPDVAVSVYIGSEDFSEKGRVKLYLNNNGTLSSKPVWVSRDSMYTFSCAFGDADGDGDLDLAVACGEAYTRRSEYNRIYYNHNGMLDSLPNWRSSERGFSYDVSWADFDANGYLDLVFANSRGPNKMYLNDGDSIRTRASWSSADASWYANSLFVADVNNDSYLDLAISDNNQLGGNGKFKIYLNRSGVLDTIPYWSSAFSGYGSGITLADINDDGYNDLISGGWWQPCQIYLNYNGTFTPDPQWISDTRSVVEAFSLGDFDNDGIMSKTIELTGNGSKKLFYLPFMHIQQIKSISINSDIVSLNLYTYNSENGWISFKTAPSLNSIITIQLIVSDDLDIAVSNWDHTIGNYVFKNKTRTEVISDNSILPLNFKLIQNYPNPFNLITVIPYSLPVYGSRVVLKIYDILGKEIAVLVDEVQEAGNKSVVFDAGNISSGIYFYRLTATASTGAVFMDVKKMMLLR